MQDFINEVLDKNDLELIDKYRTIVLDSEGDYRISDLKPIEYILRIWAQAKNQWLYKLFGDKLILEKEIKIKKNNEELRFAYEDQIRKHALLVSGFFNDIHKNIVLANSDVFSCFMFDKLKENVFGIDAIISNEYSGSDIVISNNEGELLKIQKGMKLIKLYNKLISFYDLKDKVFFSYNVPYTPLEIIEIVRNAQSIVRNQLYLKGTFCLSIHPLDYMTMSDNSCRWSSCMRWTGGGGDYRAGTVEMMNSPMVVVAYLRAKEPFTFTEGYSWNNKRWRQLFLVNKECIIGVKGYPYQNNALTKIALNWLAELAETNFNWTYDDPTYLYNWNDSSVITEDTNEYHILRHLNFETEYMYNDFGSIQRHYAKIHDVDNIYINYNYSGPMECMACGDLDISIEEERKILCRHCDNEIVYHCCNCGRRLDYENDPVYTFYDYDEDELYCEDCIGEVGFQCPICGENFHDENKVNIYALISNSVGQKTLHDIINQDDYTLYNCHVCKGCAEMLLHNPAHFFTTRLDRSVNPDVANHAKEVYYFGEEHNKLVIVAENTRILDYGYMYFYPSEFGTLLPPEIAGEIFDNEVSKIY